jgi:type II secretory pathway component PulK
MKRTCARIKSNRAPSRRGAFTVIVLVALLVVGMLVASLLRMALLQDRQLGYERLRLQASWLAESGLERAVSRSVADPGYAGETWRLEPGQLESSSAAAVVIRIEKEETNSRLRKIFVEAVYPEEGPHQARLTRETTVVISKES